MDPTYFIMLYTLLVLSDIIGLILFGSLFYITIKHRKLHSTCHLFIGLFSLFSFFSKLSTFVPYLFHIIPDLNRICPNIGLWLQFLPVCLRYGVHPMMFLIGLDRLLSVLFPIWYSTRENKFYLPSILSIPAIFLTYMIFIVANDIKTQTNIEIFLGRFGERNPSTANYILCFTVLTFLCYLLMIIKIVYGNSSSSSIRQAIFKSLGLIVLIQICSWLIKLIVPRMLDNLEPELKSFILFCLTCFISLATNSEVILLYYTSSDHRMAFKKTFGWIYRIISAFNISKISPTAAAPLGTNTNLNLKGLSTRNGQKINLATTKF